MSSPPKNTSTLSPISPPYSPTTRPSTRPISPVSIGSVSPVSPLSAERSSLQSPKYPTSSKSNPETPEPGIPNAPPSSPSMKEGSAAIEGQSAFSSTSSQDTEILDDEHEKRTSKGQVVLEEKPEEGLEKEGGRVKQTPKPKKKPDGARGGRVLTYGMNDQNEQNKG